MCDEGYTESIAGTCTKCLGEGGSWALFVFVCVVMLSLLIFMYWLILKMGSDMLEVLSAFCAVVEDRTPLNPLLQVARAHEERKRMQEDGIVMIHDPDDMEHRYRDVITAFGPPPPKPNFTFKVWTGQLSEPLPLHPGSRLTFMGVR